MYAKQEAETNPFLAGLAAAHKETEVWPENMPAINLFSQLSTQWRVGMNGPTGLDYNVLFVCLDRMKLPDQDREWLFDDIRAIEAEALQIIHRKD